MLSKISSRESARYGWYFLKTLLRRSSINCSTFQRFIILGDDFKLAPILRGGRCGLLRLRLRLPAPLRLPFGFGFRPVSLRLPAHLRRLRRFALRLPRLKPRGSSGLPGAHSLVPQFQFRAIPISNARNLIQIFNFPVSPKFPNSLGIWKFEKKW